MDPTGANVSRVTFFGYYGTEPAWARDNKRIALIRPRKDAQNVEHADLFLMNADGSNKHWARSQASSFDMRYPSWSPDGVHVVLAVMVGGKPYLATMNVTNGNMSFVLFAGKVVQGNFPSYDKTGKKILYVNDTGREIDMLDLSTATEFLMVRSEYTMGCPTLSPDGTRIAFQQVVGPNVDVYVKYLIGGATSNVRRLTTDPGYDGRAVLVAGRDQDRLPESTERKVPDLGDERRDGRKPRPDYEQCVRGEVRGVVALVDRRRGS